MNRTRTRASSGLLRWPQVAAWAGVVALVCAALPAGALAGSTAGPATVQRVSVVEESGAVEVGIEANGPVAYHTMILDDPVRYVIDLPATENAVPWTTRRVGLGALEAVRVGAGTDASAGTRVVLDLARPVPWSVRRFGPQAVVVNLTVPEAHGTATSPWSAVATASGGAERPSGAPPADSEAANGAAPATSGPGGIRTGVTAGPPAGLPGVVVGQAGGAGASQLLTLDLRDAQLGDVVDALARLCGLNVVTDSSVGASRVTVHLVGVTCEEALRFVLDANQLGYRRVGETLMIEPIARLTPPPPGPVQRIYRLQYLQPPVTTVEALVGSGSTSGTIPGGAGPVARDSATLIALFAGTGARVAYDSRTNSLIVTGTPPQQDAVQAMLRQLDVPIAEVVVQTLVVDITASAIKNLGVSWSIANGVGFTEAPPVPGQFGIGAITRDALTATLQALITQNYAKVLSDPRLATYDGQEALIFAGDQIPIVNTTTAGNPPVTTQTVTFQPIGVTLKIVPKINSDRTIDVLVHPLVTAATSFTPATSTNPNGLPIITTREAVTSLRVSDGESIVLGGLMSYSDIKNLQKIPFLGDLPLIGSLFQMTTVNHKESEVMIVLTPRIVATGQPVAPVQQ